MRWAVIRFVFGDNDTGFKWHSDGVLGIYANNARVGYIDISGLHMLANIRATGVVRCRQRKSTDVPFSIWLRVIRG